MTKHWCVVEFQDGIQIVPQLWIEGDMCYWPTTFKSTANSQKMYEKSVREYKKPEETWLLHSIRILGVYDSYELAIPKLRLAEIQSDLNTDSEEISKKSRSCRKRIIPSSDDEEQESDEEIPGIKPFPKLQKRTVKANNYFEDAGNKLQRSNHNYSSSRNSTSNATSSYDCPSPRTTVRPTNHDCSPRTTNGSPSHDYPSPRNCVTLVNSDYSLASGSTVTNRNSIQPIPDFCTHCCKFDKEYKIKTENELKEIKSQLKAVLQILRERDLRSQTLTADETNQNLIAENYEGKLPMKTVDDVESWERQLGTQDEQKKLVSFLARIGGHDINTIVKNILRRLFTDFVASLYNWEGKKGKKMFSALIVSDCIRKAAAQSPNANAKRITEQDIITAVKHWLRHASARLSNSQKKNRDDPGHEGNK